ncbi:MAG: oligosaccharide flippase family protein [Candidatus Ventricola sp.]
MKESINQRRAGVLLSYFNLGLSCVIPLFYTPIMLNILGQAEYGLYSLSNSVTSYLGLLSFGMGSAIMRYATKCRINNQTEEVCGLMGLFTLIYGFLSLLICAVGAVLVVKADAFFAKGLSYNELEKLKCLMVIMIAHMAISIPISMYSSIVSAYERFIFANIWSLFGTVLGPVLNLIILFAGYASVGMAVGGFAFQVVNGIIQYTYCKRKLNLYPSFKNMPVHFLKEIWKLSAFVFLSSIADMLYWATDKVIIGATIGAAAVAVYNVGGTFTAMLQNMAHSISSVFTPKAMMIAQKSVDTKEISELLIRVGRIQYYVVSLILSGYIVFGQRFIGLWAGAGYEDAYYVALLTMIPLAVPLIQGVAFSTIVAQNKHQFRSVLYMVIAVINVVSTYLVIPRFGIIGAASCTAIAFIVGNGIIMNGYYSFKIGLDIKGFWKNIGKISVVPLLMIIAGYYIVNVKLNIAGMVPFLAGVVLYSVIFVGLSWFFSMNSYEKNLFSGIFCKALRILKRKN